jgi:CRISPR-associated protein Csx16
VTTWFVSRHTGALQWMLRHGPAFDCHVPHLDPADVQHGDTVIGTLPVHLAAQVCARGAEYWHLVLQLPQGARGRELGMHELTALDARLQRFVIQLHPAACL